MATPQPSELSPPLLRLCRGDFTEITAHLASLRNTRAAGSALAALRPVPFVTAFRTAALQEELSKAALPEDVGCPTFSPLLTFRSCILTSSLQRPHYRICRAAARLRTQLPSGGGGVALVTSPYQNAAQAREGNDWHAVGVVRRGNTIWIFNPEFVESDYASALQPLRLASIRGVRIVQSLVQSIGAHGAHIQYCFISGLGERDRLVCVGQSVQWIEGVLDGSNPDPFTPGPEQPAAWLRLGLVGLPAV
jgi:hypothetical protein